MIPDATFEPAPPSKLRLRFSLLALLIFITLVCVLLAWWVQPRQVVATVLFQISNRKPTLIGVRDSTPADPQEFETYKNTQRAFLKSHFVLNSAVRKPGIATLPILANRDAVTWLEEHLEVEFPENSEIMSIRIRGPEEYANDLVRIADTVAKAYAEEVVFVERQREQTSRDLLARTLQNLSTEIMRKQEEVHDIAGDSSSVEVGGEAMQQVEMRRLERVESELAKLEREQLEIEGDGDAKRAAFLEKRIAQLKDQQKEIESRIKASGRTTDELMMRRREIVQLQHLADELSLQLETMDIQAEAPPRIRQLQQAVVSPE